MSDAFSFRLSRERWIALAVVLVIGCAGFVYVLRWLEFWMTFHPARMSADARSPDGAENVWFTTADGIRLHGWFFKSTLQPESATVIFFHGNGGNISDVTWVGQRLAKRGFDVLLFDYRGYGASDGELGAETELYADGDAALAFVVNEKHAEPLRVVLYGQSLGTTVAADVASRQQVGAVIIESGLSSASALAGTALPWLPSSLHVLGKNRFESAQKLTRVRAPILITHGDPDPVIPTDEARVLFAYANEPKKLLIFPGAGHNVFGVLGDQYLNQVDQFIRESITAR
jgi:alpha-beta hydrolase superfamily lysophospholipase